MKLKIISLAYILLFGSLCFPDDIFLTGGVSVTPEAHFTGFDSRTVKAQPAINTGAFFYTSFYDFFKAGLAGNLIYTLSSDLDGGWSYPGFSGFEAGLDFRFILPVSFRPEIGIGGGAGWYRYNLTSSFFFLPYASVSPSFSVYSDNQFDLFIEAPVKYYFHREADIFMSAGLSLKAAVR